MIETVHKIWTLWLLVNMGDKIFLHFWMGDKQKGQFFELGLILGNKITYHEISLLKFVILTDLVSDLFSKSRNFGRDPQ